MYVFRGIPLVLAAAALSFYAYFSAHEARLRWFDPAPALWAAADYQAQITRDKLGVPHIYAERNVDAKLLQHQLGS